MEILEPFLDSVFRALKHASERARAQAIVERWATAWQGPTRVLEVTRSNHGTYLHFNELIGTVWAHVCLFHVAPRHGLSMRGPDTDRVRKSHKHRFNKMDRDPLDTLFEIWSAHPEARPANNAVEFFLNETPDETWEACLQEALKCLAPSKK